MSESPVYKLARLVGGVAMLPGPLGHQALGQLLISGSKDVEVAGANVALATAFQQPNTAIQIAVGSLVPAAVVQSLSRKEQRRLEEARQRLERLSKEIAQQPYAVDQIALRSILPAMVVEALIRNEQRRLEKEQRRIEVERHQQQDLEALSEELRGERTRMMDLRRDLEKRQPQQEALSKEVFELRNHNERLQREMKDLQSRLDEYTRVPEEAPATDSKEPSVSGNPAADPSSELASPKKRRYLSLCRLRKKGKPPT